MKCLFLIAAYLLVFAPNTAQAQSLQTRAKQAIIVDHETGTILYAKNATDKMPTSSMSKVMTMYMVFEALKSGIIHLDDTFKVSEKAWRKGGSKMFVGVNKDIKIQDLIRGVIIQSGNDATIVLAEGLAGSEIAFAESMNKKAATLGMENSNFKNASGWPDPDHYSTAYDLALLGQQLINNFPQYYAYYAEKEFTYNDIKQANRNPLLHQNIGADGIKTGHTEAGGYGLIGSGVQNDRRVVMVINGLDSTNARAEESKKLLQWGLRNFKNHLFFKPGDTITNAAVSLGKVDTVALTTQKDIYTTIPRNADKNIAIKTQIQSPLIAPIAHGQKIGTVTISAPGLDDVSYPLITAKAVEELGLFSRVIAKAKHLIAGS